MQKSIPKCFSGWLLVFTVWVALNILASVAWSLYQFISTWEEMATFRLASFIDCSVVILWNMIYAWFLVQFIQLRPGSLRKIKFMLSLTPVFATVEPLLPAALVFYQLKGHVFTQLIKEMYASETTIAQLCGMYLASVLWFVYLCCSRRVKSTFML